MRAVKLCFNKFPPILNWGCLLVQVNLYNGQKVVIVVLVILPVLDRTKSCLLSLHLWLCHNGLALNSGKSESILFSTPSRIGNFPLYLM